MTADLSRPASLPPAPWMRASATLAVVAALEAEGGAGVARYVGGCVRDTLLGLPAAMSSRGEAGEGALDIDIDIATPLPPPQVVRTLERAGLKAVPTGIEHGTVTAVSEGRPFEITTLRRDVATDGRHAQVAFTDDWAEDAARRDFRLNALYADPDGRLHDPTGDGVADALAGRVVFVGAPANRIAEDYLRILRFFRFQAWYGRGAPDAEGLTACAALAGGLATLSAERVAKEVLKLLAAPDPLPSVRGMQATGVLARLPVEADVARLERVCGLEQALGLAPDALLRLAALSRAAPQVVAERLRLSKSQRERLQAAEGLLENPATLTSRAVRRAVYALGAAVFRDRLLLQGGEAARVREWLDEAQAWRAPRFPLDGAQIKAAGVAEGREVGRVRRAVEGWWIDHDFPDDPMALAAALKAAVAEPPG